jgi:hypothetical protein
MNDITNDIPLKKRRNRIKQTVPLRERLLKSAEFARERANQLPPGQERQGLLRKAQQAEVVADLETSLGRPVTK